MASYPGERPHDGRIRVRITGVNPRDNGDRIAIAVMFALQVFGLQDWDAGRHALICRLAHMTTSQCPLTHRVLEASRVLVVSHVKLSVRVRGNLRKPPKELNDRIVAVVVIAAKHEMQGPVQLVQVEPTIGRFDLTDLVLNSHGQVSLALR